MGQVPRPESHLIALLKFGEAEPNFAGQSRRSRSRPLCYWARLCQSWTTYVYSPVIHGGHVLVLVEIGGLRYTGLRQSARRACCASACKLADLYLFWYNLVVVLAKLFRQARL